MFSRGIAYSRSPAASRACLGSGNISIDVAVPSRIAPQVRVVDLDRRVPPLGHISKGDEHHNLVAPFDEVRWLSRGFLPDAVPVFEIALNFRAPAVRTGVESRWGRQFKVWVQVTKHAIPVSAVAAA
jgi:hypothetical protein